MRMLAHQMFYIERHLPSFFGFCFLLKGGHAARLDPVSNHPIDFTVGNSVHSVTCEIGRFCFHRFRDIRLCFAVLPVAGSAAPSEEATPGLYVRFGCGQWILQLLSARRRMAMPLMSKASDVNKQR